MELVICFGLAISVFTLIILSVVGLISAPTPILLGILIFGVMLTQKSINGLAEPKIIVEEDQDNIELVEKNPVSSNKKEIADSMVYRGSHYVNQAKINYVSHQKVEKLKYRGVELNNTQEKQV